MQVKLNEIQCKRCNHVWLPRKIDVRQCPKCRSVLWDITKEKK